jgi:hypothetical protein
VVSAYFDKKDDHEFGMYCAKMTGLVGMQVCDRFPTMISRTIPMETDEFFACAIPKERLASARIVFLDMDGVITSNRRSNNVFAGTILSSIVEVLNVRWKALYTNVPEEHLTHMIMKPEYHAGLLPWRLWLEQDLLDRLVTWQNEDPDLYFVMSTSHLTHHSANIFRDLYLYPLRIVGSVALTNGRMRGGFAWIEKYIGSQGIDRCRFVFLDDDGENFTEKNKKIYPECWTYVDNMLQDSDILDAKARLNQYWWPTNADELLQNKEMWKNRVVDCKMRDCVIQ